MKENIMNNSLESPSSYTQGFLMGSYGFFRSVKVLSFLNGFLLDKLSDLGSGHRENRFGSVRTPWTLERNLFF